MSLLASISGHFYFPVADSRLGVAIYLCLGCRHSKTAVAAFKGVALNRGLMVD